MTLEVMTNAIVALLVEVERARKNVEMAQLEVTRKTRKTRKLAEI